MPVPQYYGDVNLVIKVDPIAMFHEASVVMPAQGTEIANSINRIVEVFNGIKVGWAGNSADEAQAFNDNWNGAVTKLFGTKADPSTGILNQIGESVSQASVHYAGSEKVVTKMFQDIAADLNAASAGTGTPDPHRDVSVGPITEHN